MVGMDGMEGVSVTGPYKLSDRYYSDNVFTV
jgi:hypothetical protein